MTRNTLNASRVRSGCNNLYYATVVLSIGLLLRQWYVLNLLIFILEPELRKFPAVEDEEYANHPLHDIAYGVRNNTEHPFAFMHSHTRRWNTVAAHGLA